MSNEVLHLFELMEERFSPFAAVSGPLLAALFPYENGIRQIFLASLKAAAVEFAKEELNHQTQDLQNSVVAQLEEATALLNESNAQLRNALF